MTGLRPLCNTTLSFPNLSSFEPYRQEPIMKRIVSLVLLLLTSTSLGSLAFAQSRDGDAAGAACGALACGAGGILYILFVVLIVAIPIAIFVVIIVFVIKFIRKDAISRGMPNPDSIKWLGLLGFLGLVIYLLQRPDTMYMPCSNCGKPRSPGGPCPHCGNA
jgi:hypothetical protein